MQQGTNLEPDTTETSRRTQAGHQFRNPPTTPQLAIQKLNSLLHTSQIPRK